MVVSLAILAIFLALVLRAVLVVGDTSSFASLS